MVNFIDDVLSPIYYCIVGTLLLDWNLKTIASMTDDIKQQYDSTEVMSYKREQSEIEKVVRDEWEKHIICASFLKKKENFVTTIY